MPMRQSISATAAARGIADVLDVPLTSVDIERFRDQEIFAKINENVRGEDIFLIQPTSAPANDHLMELLILIDALVRASAQRLFVSPDTGGVVRTRAIAKMFNADIAIVDKRRPKAGESEVMNIIGDVAGRTCILYDDIIDSGGTLCNAAVALKDHGANSVSAYITHGVLSDPAVERINKSELTELVITDTINQPEKVKNCDRIRECTTSKLLGEAIRRIANDESVSKLFG